VNDDTIKQNKKHESGSGLWEEDDEFSFVELN
jgi:hypothetical protein